MSPRFGPWVACLHVSLRVSEVKGAQARVEALVARLERMAAVTR